MLYAFFWVITRRLNFGSDVSEHPVCSIFIGRWLCEGISSHNNLPMKMEKTGCSETSEHKIQTPGNNPEQSKEFSNYNQQDETFLKFISTDTLHVSGGSSFHHQEHKTVHTASGIINQYCCLLLPWMRWNSISSTIAAGSSHGSTNTWSCVQFCAPADGRKYRLKHVEQLVEINKIEKYSMK